MRPYVICHMTMSIDGKVTGAFLSREECAPATEEYYRLNREIPAEAFACGRVTMEESFTGGWYPDLNEFANIKMSRGDFIADQDASRYAIAFDRKGRLGWKTSKIEDEDPGYGGAHIVEVLCEDVKDAYLAYLQSIGVSYIFAGKSEMNLEVALEKLWSNFFINDLLLEGGSEINGAFERAGLIDELSLVQTSVVADADSKTLFARSNLGDYILKEAKVVSDSVLYLRYLQKNNRTYRVMKEFIEELDNQKIQSELYRAIQGRGAFRRFKDKIRYEGIEQQWYDFQNNAYWEFALRWCKENNIRCDMDE